MKCPNCGLDNPETAQRCDCGYAFEAKAAPATPSTASRGSAWKAVRWIIGVPVLIFGIYQMVDGIRSMRKGSIPPPPSSPVFRSYDDAKRGIRIKVPQDWKVQDGQMLALSGPAGMNVRVGVQAISASLEDYTKQNMAEIKGIHELAKDIDLINLGEATPAVLAGSPARAVEYTIRIKGIVAKGRQVWTVKNNKACVITFTASEQSYESYLPLAKAVAESLEMRP